MCSSSQVEEATLTEAQRVLELLGTALDRLLHSSTDRIALPYLLGSLVIASLVWLRRARSTGNLWRFLFPKALWWHPSARLDYALLLTRTVLDLVLLSSLAVSTTGVSFFVARTLWRHVGILPTLQIDPWLITAFFSISAFVAEDFVRFALHRLAHRWPAFWELHKVHHSAEVLTPLTIFRVHPIEGLINSSAAALTVGILGGVVTWLFPGKLAAWSISGTYALQYVWNILGTNLRHSHVWLSYGRAVEHLLISPAQHQVHHSVDPKHHSANYGSVFAVWDWLFNSLYVTGPRERLVFGLPDAERNRTSSVFSILVSPCWAAARTLGNRTSALTRRALRRRLDAVDANTIPAAGGLGEHGHS